MPRTRDQEPTFEVYAKEPLVRGLARLNLSPIGIGVAFLATVSLPLTVWAALTVRDKPSFVAYFESVSWSVSMVFLFPFMVALTFKYYREIPELFVDLFSQVAMKEDGPPSRSNFEQYLAQRFSSGLAPIVFLLATLVLNYIYYRQLANGSPGTTWITDGTYGQSFFFSKSGLSAIGAYSAVIQVTLVYWTFNLIWNACILSSSLHKFFAVFGDRLSLEPLHPDGCLGLHKLRSICMTFSTILFLSGLYLSLKVIDKIVVQNRSLFSDIGNPILLASYAILAPLLFFLPMSPAHRSMQRAKDGVLLPLAKYYHRRVNCLSLGADKDDIQAIEGLSSIYRDLQKQIPVWPFDFHSLRAFFATIVVPVLPIVLPVVVELFIKHGWGGG